MTNALYESYYCTSYLFLHNIFKITKQFTKYRDHELLDILIVSMEKKILQYWKTLPLLLLLELAMNLKYKLKGVFFCVCIIFTRICALIKKMI